MTRATRTPRTVGDSRQILALLAAGHTHGQIARRIGLSRKAVVYRLGCIYRELGAVNGPHAVAIAIRDGLINVKQKAEQQ